MNNSYYLYAEKVKKKYNPISNLAFLVKELWRFDKFYLASLWIQPIPTLMAEYLETIIPALVVQGLERKDDLKTLLLTIALVGCVYIISRVFHFALAFSGHEKRSFLNFYLTDRFLQKMPDVDYELIESATYQETYSNAWNSANNARGFYEGTYFLRNIVTLTVGIGIYGFILGSRSIIILLLVFACVGVNLYLLSVARKVHKKYYGKISKYAKGEAYITEISMDSASGKDIRIYNMLDFIIRKYDDNLEQMGKHYGKIHNWYLFRNVSGAVLSFVRDIFAYLFLIGELVAGKLSAAEFVFLLAVITTLANYFEKLLRELMGFNTLDASVSYFRQYLEIESSYPSKSGVSVAKLEELKKQGIRIELEDVSYTYEGADTPTISHFNLTIQQGEKLALIGLNGAGKTTLVKLICGFYTPDEGKIRINGIDKEQFTKEEYASLMSVMFQDAYFLPVTLDENLTGKKVCDKDRLRKALKLSGFEERYERLPQKGASKLIKKLEKDAVDFSGGEKQKLIFARAIYRNAPLVILDEPTAALDPISEHEMYCNFREAVGNRTAIYISHRLSSTRFCDRIILIENGGIIEEGSHDSLLAKGGRYAELYDMQSKYYKEEQVRKAKQRIMEEGGENLE